MQDLPEKEFTQETIFKRIRFYRNEDPSNVRTLRRGRGEIKLQQIECQEHAIFGVSLHGAAPLYTRGLNYLQYYETSQHANGCFITPR